MKNLGSLAMLLLAGAGYVASLPAGDVQQNEVRAVGYDTYHEILAREPKKKNKNAGAGKSASSVHIT
jgi:hypothetical protein